MEHTDSPPPAGGQSTEFDQPAGVIARVLGEHRYLAVNAGGRTGCRGCRWTHPTAQSATGRRAHEAHVALEILHELAAKSRGVYEVRFGDGEVTDWLKAEEKARFHLDYLREYIARDEVDPEDYEPMAVVTRTVTSIKHKTPWAEVRDA